ncbi:hypothetical protein ACE01N_20675, partial [Saccharicrinis sp. FJH2]|uniref:hypothetical protein n=1 Tax=Saccharicrinis sp. FJH65 TaxID=3344659 RepID=UPI0035F41C7D
MEKFEIKYYTFWNRFLVKSALIHLTLLLIILNVYLFLMTDTSSLEIKIFEYISWSLLIILVLTRYIRSIYYLSSVEFQENNLKINVHKFDLPLETKIIDYKDLDIDICINFLEGVHQNSYRLELRQRNEEDNFTLDLIHKQYEIGYWKRESIKKLFS